MHGAGRIQARAQICGRENAVSVRQVCETYLDWGIAVYEWQKEAC